RFLFPDKNKLLPCAPDKLPEDFFIAPEFLASRQRRKKHGLYNREQTKEKLRTKLLKIRNRYRDPWKSGKKYDDWVEPTPENPNPIENQPVCLSSDSELSDLM